MLTIILNNNLLKQDIEKHISDLIIQSNLDLSTPSLYYSEYEHTTNMIKGSTHNHLINAFIAAYNNHLPLRLRPDDILMALQMIIATCINNNSEKMRNLFVEHSDKMTLTVTRATFDLNYFCNQFKLLMQKNIKNPEFITKYTTSFSTTSILHSTISNMFLMNSLKEYFSFEMILDCGIPSVILEGTQEDWLQLKDFYEYFKNFLKDTELKDFFLHFDIIFYMFIEMRLLQEEGIAEATNNMKKLWERVISFIPQGSGSDTILGGWARLLVPYSSENTLIGFDKKIKCLDIEINVPCNIENCSYKEQDILREYYFASGWNSMQKSCLITPCDLLVPEEIVPINQEYIDVQDGMVLYKVELYSGFFNPTIIDNVVSTNVGFIMREDMGVVKQKMKKEYINQGCKIEGPFNSLMIPITLKSKFSEISDCFDTHDGRYYVVDKEKKIEYYLNNGVIKKTIEKKMYGIKSNNLQIVSIPEKFRDCADEIYMCFNINHYGITNSTFY